MAADVSRTPARSCRRSTARTAGTRSSRRTGRRPTAGAAAPACAPSRSACVATGVQDGMTIASQADDHCVAEAADAEFDGIADPVEQALAVAPLGAATPSATGSPSRRPWPTGCSPTSPAGHDPGVHVVFLDTGYHFAETIGTRDAIAGVLPVTLVERDRRRRPSPSRTPRYGPRLHDRDPDLCCCDAQGRAARPRRWPAVRGLGDRACAATSRRRAPTRRSSTGTPGAAMVKVNPIAAWTQDDVDALHRRARRAGQPAGPSSATLDRLRALHPRGRARARTRAPAAGPARAKTECGLHA